MFQVKRSPQVYDVVVIGSGAGGGTAVKVLTDLGINVALLEAGPMLNPAKDFKEHVLPYQVDHRGAGAHAEQYFGRQQWGYFSAPNGYWDIAGEPYTVAKDNEFRWFRSRIIGGRTNHYGRISLRFSDYDFKPYSTDGLGCDWPVTYDEIVALVRQSRGIHRRHRHQGGHPHRARRQLPAAHSAARARSADPARQQEARHPLHPVAHGDAHQAVSTAAPPAIIADSADAAARPRRPSPPARR